MTYKGVISISYPSNDIANIIGNSINSDMLVKSNINNYNIIIYENKIILELNCIDLKTLRISTGAFYNIISLATKTLIEFK